MKKIVVFLANGFEEIEALSPVDYLRRAGEDVVTVAVGTSNRTVESSHKVSVLADITFDSYLDSLDDLPDAVVVPGGMPGSSNIAECSKALSFIDEMNEKQKLVCAICAAPALVLSKTKALAGKKWTCYPDMEKNAPSYAGNHITTEPFIHDGNLITARGPGAAEQFAMEIVKTLSGNDVYSKIKSAAVMR
ncbi:MAG: DJ-1/PfpI family protein [Spirochaetia bacterium]|nr:DJ-1/PfpI family protein [Spirochaetia bacterium]